MYVSRLFKKWRWSYKTPERKQILKYTKENISYYGTYITTAYCIPWDRLKFMDEGHFVSKDLHRKRAIGPKGTRSHTVVQDGLNKSLSLTIMTTLSNPNVPVVCSSPRAESNSEYDFADFVIYCLEYKHLTPGDILVIDNASVHLGTETTKMLVSICGIAQVRITFLPKYSPELNPCELVFSFIKSYIREHRHYYPRYQLWALIAKALARFTDANLWMYYHHCLESLEG